MRGEVGGGEGLIGGWGCDLGRRDDISRKVSGESERGRESHTDTEIDAQLSKELTRDSERRKIEKTHVRPPLKKTLLLTHIPHPFPSHTPFPPLNPDLPSQYPATKIQSQARSPWALYRGLRPQSRSALSPVEETWEGRCGAAQKSSLSDRWA